MWAMDTRDASNKGGFPALLHLTFILQQVSDELLLKEVGIGLSQARIMSVLHPSVAKSQKLVATALSQTEANVSRQLRVMKKDGLVHVAKNKKDGRQKDVTLTVKGIKKYDQAKDILKDQQSRLLKLLSNSEVEAFEHATRNLSAQHGRRS
ncbi:hypothetical protein A2884_02200 [Candidatus Saccharibacteria bacterium RIFCSPHIGHO2_01_FULL_48_12]|nr:MAG: hypothetical protein A2884_02200 [Candidatus Saccharibacteria bacterium RIFCSPHIGHO2_01_FULL_48_12]